MKKRQRCIANLVLFFILVAAISGCSSVSRARSVKRLPEGWQELSLIHDGLTRWYRIYSPESLPDQAPLVLYLHGGTLSMRSLFSPFADSTATWFEIAEEQGIVLVVPNGVNPKTGDTYGDDQTWNDIRPDQADGQTQVDDVGFILQLLDQVSAELPIDPDRIYVTGASNGGMMTYRLLIEAPERFAAGAAYIANLPVLTEPLPQPAQSVPLLIMNGTLDPLMPFEGGLVASDRGRVISTQETVQWWVRMNGADENRKQTRWLPDLDPDDNCQIREEIFPNADGGAEVWLYIMEGGGHTLPSLNTPSRSSRLFSRLVGPVCHDADGVQLAWAFFSEISGRSAP